MASSPPGSPVSNISYPPYCSSVLAALPALCSLVLHGPAASTLLGAVPACMGLKQLTLSNLPCTKVHMLQDLPPQLQVCVLGGEGAWGCVYALYVLLPWLQRLSKGVLQLACSSLLSQFCLKPDHQNALCLLSVSICTHPAHRTHPFCCCFVLLPRLGAVCVC